nr:LolA-related protein [Siccirubricoccus soli]
MQGLAGVRARRSRFTEDKVIPELETGQPNEGTLLWQAPDRLEKHTTWPIDERVAVAGGRLTYERRDRGVKREFALAEQPEMQALVEAVRGTLAGDLAALRQHYEVGFSATPEGWRMVLVPRSLRVRGAVQRITVTGQGTELRGVNVEGGGGVDRMRIAPAE